MKSMQWMKKLFLVLAGLLFAGGFASVNAYERVTYIHTDVLGSPIAASDEDGNIVWRESYQPYGKRLLEEAHSDRLWYTGKYEEDIGLVYFGRRWYNPEIGRFYSADPVRFDESNIHSFNRYAYANNNPYAYIDPDGEEPLFLAVFRRNTTIDQAMEQSEPFRRSLEVGGTLIYGVGAAIDTGTDIASPLKGALKRGLKRLFKDATKRGTTVIGRVKDLQNLRKGEQSLLNRLPDRGSPKANWKQNSGVLRQEMARGKPIRDASPGDTSGQFLNAERNLLRDRGWTFDSKTNYWNPPN